MVKALESAIVRIYSNSGQVIGAGFSASPSHIITCAHVVASALSISSTNSEIPAGLILLDFPRIAPGQMLKAQVILWQPVHLNALDETPEDIAVLELQSPPPTGIKPVRLVTSEDLWNHSFRTLGFPDGKSNGAWASGVLRGRLANGWVQLEDVKAPGYRLEEGFSGAPVWDEKLQGVVGMAVAAEKKRTDAKAAFIIPKNQLVKVWPELGEYPCPYRGLLAFREEDVSLFFGQETFTDDLIKAVQSQSLVAVIGTSGSGKSSVVFAGLIPYLRSQGNWRIAVFRPNDRPLYALAGELIPLLEPDLSKTDRMQKTRKLAEEFQTSDLALRDTVEALAWGDPGTHLLLIIDQFEELYTLCKEDKRQSFLDRLLEAVNHAPNFKVVITLRADFLGYALEYRPLADALQYADLKLGPMNRQELQQVIEKPAQECDVQFEPGLSDRILNDLLTNVVSLPATDKNIQAASSELFTERVTREKTGNLPLLQFALMQLWDEQKSGQITHAAYEKLGREKDGERGGIKKFLANYAEQEIYSNLNPLQRKQTQRIFLQLVRPGEGTEDTRRLATRAEVGEENWNLVKYLADKRLLVTGRDKTTGEETVEIVHEALIQEWERLHQWLDENRESIRRARNIEAAAQEWKDKGKPKALAYLLQRPKLIEAENLLQIDSAVYLSNLAQEFIKESRKAHRKAQVKTGVAIAIPVVAIALSGVAIWQQRVQQRFQQLREAALFGTASPELLNILPDFLQEAERYKQANDVEKAIDYYRGVWTVTRNLKKAVEEDPKKFQQQDVRRIEEFRKKAEPSLVEMIQKYRIPKLEEELENGKIGEKKYLNVKYSELEKQYTEGALQTTYKILMQDLGADINKTGRLENREETAQIPCDTLKKIDELWRQKTKKSCGLYGSNSDPYTDADCPQLKNRSLTIWIFVPPYNLVIDHLNSCKIISEP